MLGRYEGRDSVAVIFHVVVAKRHAERIVRGLHEVLHDPSDRNEMCELMVYDTIDLL
jgi:hypothetical protein